MTTAKNFAYDLENVKIELHGQLDRAVEWVFAAAESGSGARSIEQAVWCGLLVLGRTLLGAAMAIRSRRSTLDDLGARGLSPAEVRPRSGGDYAATVTTTLGKVSFPLFAYRMSNGQTLVPARQEVLSCRCSRTPDLLSCWSSGSVDSAL